MKKRAARAVPSPLSFSSRYNKSMRPVKRDYGCSSKLSVEQYTQSIVDTLFVGLRQK